MVRAQLDNPHRDLPSSLSLPAHRPGLLQAVDRQIRHTFHLLPQRLAQLSRRRQDNPPPPVNSHIGDKIHDLDCIEIRQRSARVDEF